MSALPPLSTRSAQPTAPHRTASKRLGSAFSIDATSSRKPWRPSGPASAGSTAPLPSSLVQPSAFRFSLFAFRFSPLALLLSLLLLAPSASAATATNTNNSLGWDTNSTGWDTVTGNAWSSVNGPTNTAVFTNTSGSIQVLNPITIGGLTYSPAGTFSIWGSQINLGTNSTFNVTNAASALTILSTIAGNYSLTKSGSGTLALSSSNSYSGGTTVSAGTVAVGDKNALGTGVVTLSGGTIRASTDLSGANAITNNFFNNSGTATFTGSNNLTISGAWTNNGSRSIANNMNDNATLTLSSPIGISATTGTQTLTLGGTAGNTTAITGNISNGTSTTGILTVNSSGVTSLSGSNSYTGGTLFSGNGFLLLGNRNALGTRSVTYNGGGTIRASTDLSGANAITNNFYLANTATLSGTNNLTISGAWTNNGSRTINSTMLNNASLTFSGPVIISDTAGAATLTIAANSTSGNTVISGNISNGNSTSGSLLKSGAGALTLSGSNTYNGLTTVTAGTLRVGNNSALGTGTLVLNGGALSASDSVTARTVTNKILFSTNATLGDSVNNAALTLSGIGDLGTNTRTLTINSAVTFAGVLSNTAGITVGGVAGNLLTLSGNNTYSGTTTVGNNSRLLIQNNNGLGATSGTTTVSSGGALQLQGGITVGAEALTLNGTGVNNIGGALRNISGTNTYGGAITLAANSRINSDADLLIITGGITGATRALTVGGSGNTTINSAIDTTTGTLTKDGTGTLTLSGVNTFTGNTTISAGVLTIAATTALPGWNTSGIYSVGNGATLAVYNAVTDANITNMVYGTTNFTSGSAIGFDTTTANRTSSLVLSNTSRGNLGLSKMGANTLTLSGVNTYTGTTTIFGGTLLASNTNALGATNGAIAAMGGILDLGGNAFNRTGLITFSGGTVTNGTLSNNTTTNFAAQSGTVAAILAGSAGLTQSGTGTTTLAAANTYTGTTTISGGTLAYGINDAIVNANAVTVNGGTLAIGAFSDTVGAVTLGSGSITGTTGVLTGSSYSVTSGLISANLGGSSSTLTKGGTGIVTLSGSNSYSNTVVNAGILSIATTNALPGWSTSGAYSVASGATLAVYNIFTDADITSMVYGTTNFASGSAIGYDTTSGNRTLTLALSNTANGAGILGLTKAGANTLTIANADALGDGSGALTVSGGTLDLGGFSSLRTGLITFSGGSVINGILSNNTATSFSATGTGTVSATLAGSAGLTQSGTGTLTLAAANTYTGLTTVNAGTLRYGTNNAIATGGVTVNGSTLDIGAFSDTVGAITVSAGGNITGTTGVLTGTGMTVTSAQGNSLISANLGGAYRLNITGNNLGTGTVTLSGSNSFTGVELANANTVRLNINNNNALGTGSLTLANSEIGNTSGSVVTVTNTFFIGGNTSFTWMGGHLVGKVFITDSTSAAFRMANAGSLTFDRLDSSAGSRILSFGDNTSGMDGQFIIKEAAGSNISGAVTLGSSGAQIWNFLLGSGRAFGTGTITVGSGFNIQASQDLTGANAFNNVWLLNNVSGANNPYTFSGSNSIALNGTLSVTNANTGQQIVNNISTGKTLTLTNVNLNLNTNTTSSFETVFSGPGDTIITGTVSNGAGTSRALTYRGTNATSTNAGSLTLMGSNTYNGLTTVTAGTLRVGNNSALGTGTLLLNGGALSASDSVTARTLTNNFRFSNNATLGDSVNSAALTLSGTGDLGTTTRIITNNSAVTFAGVLSNTAGITKAGNGTLTLAAANTYNGTTTVNAGTLAYGINDAIATNGVIVNGGTLDIGAFSDTVGAVTLGSGTISGGTGTLTGSSYSVTNTSGNALISAILGGSGTLTKTGAGILSIARTNALPGWSTSGRFSVASGSTLAVYNAFSDADITTMVYGTTNFASNSAIGFDTTTDNREYSLVLSNTSRGNLGLTKTGANTLTLTAANSYTGTTTVNGGTLALSGGDNRLSTAGSVAVSSGATLNLGGNSQTLAGLTGSGSVTNTAGTLTLDVASGNNTFGGSISGSGSLTKSGNGTVTLTSANTYTGTTTINGGTLRINSSSAIGTNTVTLANATFLSYIGSGVSSLNNAITVGSGTATIDNSGGSTLTLGGTLAKNGTTLTLNGGSGGINVTGSITGSDPNSDLVIGSGTVTLSGSNSYNGPTFVNNGATLNADSALPTDNGASDLLLDSTGSGGSTVNLGIDQTIASLSGASSSTVNLNARTLTINSGSGTVTYAGSITGSGNLLKSGSLTQMLTGTSAYTGTTTVNGGALSLGTSGKLTGTTSVTVTNGATLLLGSSVANSINSAAALNLGGGQLSMGAAGTGGSRASSQTFASLTLTANSSIDFSSLTGSSSLYFSNISGLSGYTLSIYNYNGQTTGSGTDFTKLYAATSSTGGFSANLGNILFYSGGDTSSLLGSASFGGTVGGFTEITDIVPVPEPSVVIAALMLLAWLLYTNRGAMRRLIGC